jgi:hypothetical protein
LADRDPSRRKFPNALVFSDVGQEKYFAIEQSRSHHTKHVRTSMYTLVAQAATPQWSGEIGRATFETLAEAEKEMARWADFGVDNYCNEADHIRIFDSNSAELRRWNWRTRRAEPVEPDTAATS